MLLHGKLRHCQFQVSVEKSIQETRDMLITLMVYNNSKKWSEGLRFI